jgi:hypothetical protein
MTTAYLATLGPGIGRVEDRGQFGLGRVHRVHRGAVAAHADAIGCVYVGAA